MKYFKTSSVSSSTWPAQLGDRSSLSHNLRPIVSSSVLAGIMLAISSIACEAQSPLQGVVEPDAHFSVPTNSWSAPVSNRVAEASACLAEVLPMQVLRQSIRFCQASTNLEIRQLGLELQKLQRFYIPQYAGPLADVPGVAFLPLRDRGTSTLAYAELDLDQDEALRRALSTNVCEHWTVTRTISSGELLALARLGYLAADLSLKIDQLTPLAQRDEWKSFEQRVRAFAQQPVITLAVTNSANGATREVTFRFSPDLCFSFPNYYLSYEASNGVVFRGTSVVIPKANPLNPASSDQFVTSSTLYLIARGASFETARGDGMLLCVFRDGVNFHAVQDFSAAPGSHRSTQSLREKFKIPLPLSEEGAAQKPCITLVELDSVLHAFAKSRWPTFNADVMFKDLLELTKLLNEFLVKKYALSPAAEPLTSMSLEASLTSPYQVAALDEFIAQSVGSLKGAKEQGSARVVRASALEDLILKLPSRIRAALSDAPAMRNPRASAALSNVSVSDIQAVVDALSTLEEKQ